MGRVLCRPTPNSHNVPRRTCFARQSEKRSQPCPLCEGYRSPNDPLYRELVGWEPSGSGIMKPMYSKGKRREV